jgi:hypothetical protein
VNSKEIRAVRDASKRFMPSLVVDEVPDLPNSLRITVSVDPSIYFFVGRRGSDGRFYFLLPIQSAGLIPSTSTLERLQPLLKSYGLLLSQEAVIIEENIKIPLHERIGKMVWALIALDGVRRLWKVEADRRENVKSEDTEPVGHNPNNSSSR